MKLAIIASMAIVAWYGTGHAEVIPGSAFRSGNWSGGAYADNRTGKFTHCAISAPYLSGDTLYFTVNENATINVAIESPGLDLVAGNSFPVSLSVDRRNPYRGTATAVSKDFATLNIPEFGRALEAFMRGRTLVIDSPKGRGTYDLSGTFRALEATRACAIRHYDYAAASAPAPVAPDKTETFQLASMVVAELGIRSFRFLNEAELAQRGWQNAVAWTSPENGMSGINLIVPREGVDDLRSSDAEDTQFLTQGCMGDYATSARAMVLENAGAARELRLVCRTAEGETETYLSKFFSGTRIVYNVLQFTGSEAAEPDAARQARSQAATLRAASLTLE